MRGRVGKQDRECACKYWVWGSESWGIDGDMVMRGSVAEDWRVREAR